MNISNLVKYYHDITEILNFEIIWKYKVTLDQVIANSGEFEVLTNILRMFTSAQRVSLYLRTGSANSELQ